MHEKTAIVFPKPLWVFAIYLGIPIILSLLQCGTPLIGDQALFMYGATSLDRGETLYVDFWDSKLPGVYLFYKIGGTLFGFTGFGVRLFEVLWNGLLAFLLWREARTLFHHRWLVWLLPLITVGYYYAVVDEHHQTQVEFLVALPFIGCLTCANAAAFGGHPVWRRVMFWFGSGVCAGVIAIFKPVLAPLAITLWITVTIFQIYFNGFSWRRLALFFFPTFLGGLFVLAAVSFWMIATGAWERFIWTMFVFPGEVFSEIDRAPLWRLIKGGVRIIGPALLFIPLLYWAIRSLRARRGDIFFVEALVWLLTGIGLILLQKVAWWHYHYLLLVVPLGILYLRGLDQVLPKVADRFKLCRRFQLSTVATGLVLIGFVPIAAAKFTLGYSKYFELLQSGDFSRHNIGMTVSKVYQRNFANSRFVREAGIIGKPIYVMGDPVIYLQTKCTQAFPMNGWVWEYYSKKQWAELPELLRQHKPAAFFIDVEYETMVDVKLPGFKELLGETYEEQHRVDRGIWYWNLKPAAAAYGASEKLVGE